MGRGKDWPMAQKCAVKHMADDDGESLPPSAESAVSDDDELPPDVLSEGGSGSDGSLPWEQLMALGTKCACKKKCDEKVSLQAVLSSRREHLNLSDEDRKR